MRYIVLPWRVPHNRFLMLEEAVEDRPTSAQAPGWSPPPCPGVDGALDLHRPMQSSVNLPANPKRAWFGPPGWRVGLERKDRAELGSVILPFVGWISSNRVQIYVVQCTRGVDRLLEAERSPAVHFVV